MITRLPMENFAAHDIRSYSKMSARELARSYIVDGLFVPGRIELRHWETDRTVVGGASPLGRALVLEAPARLKADHFNDRRELGVTNIGGPGAVTVDGRRFKLNKLDCLYVGRGAKKVVFSSIRKSTPAKYYLLSYPAHTRFPNRLARYSPGGGIALGAPETENRRFLNKVIHPGGIKSCQLVMGFTIIAPGSRWNTMPPHTHACRSEVYLYFDLNKGGSVTHYMGPGERVRKLKLGNQQAVLSPPWSIHCGSGSTHYTFIWGRGGENQEFSDMDPVDPKVVR